MSKRTIEAALHVGRRIPGLLMLVGLTACGGSQPPPDAPAAEPPPPDTPAAEAPAAPEGEHTMPDGTKMEGHEHGAGTDEHKH
jgi:hypothetical protein